MDYERRVSLANESGKIFRVSESYDAPMIRQALIERGFIEQKAQPYNSVYLNINYALECNRIKNVQEYEQVILYKICGNRAPDFAWVSRHEHYYLYPDSMCVNRIQIPGLSFVNKADLCCYVDKIQEILDNEDAHRMEKCETESQISQETVTDADDEYETASDDEEDNQVKNNKKGETNMALVKRIRAGVSNEAIKLPRSYDIVYNSDEAAFKKNFRLGCALGVVMFLNEQPNIEDWFIEYGEDDDPSQIVGQRLKALDFIFHVIVTNIRVLEGQIDKSHVDERNCELSEAEWLYISRTHQNTVRDKKKFKAPAALKDIYVSRIKYVAEDIPYYWPERWHDGCNNIYLLKPCDSGNGYGIILLDAERKIISVARCQKRKYIAQKYIERPLLIYGVKFDIRQYFFITMHNNKFRAWAHDACTIKFATDQFTLDTLAENIHITNVTIQKRFTRKPDDKLPKNNAWGMPDLLAYFAAIGKPNIWETTLYPAIKKILSYIAELSFRNCEIMNGRFEIFGCDWLITEDFKTVLIEINRSPSMDYYTPIHKVVLEEVLSDVIRVVIDYAKDETSSTGRFEMIFEKDYSWIDTALMPYRFSLDSNW
ncbi:tubulin glycylase 3B-like [Culicoides brevitarsis]|uniref:tubulin glycylase 3B-like n=1 Tax=Culicoides brevitarsis TaxID=469753 RepID=UPI00307B243B